MNAEELVAKIRAECKYTGSSKVEGYVYYRAIGDVEAIVIRELPAAPEPTPVKTKDYKKKKGDEELGTPGSPYDSKE